MSKELKAIKRHLNNLDNSEILHICKSFECPKARKRFQEYSTGTLDIFDLLILIEVEKAKRNIQIF